MSSRPAAEPTVTLDLRLEGHRAELTSYCRRIVGSAEAEDAVQETMVRAWRGFQDFEGRAALRSWLYRIATNVCFDMSRAKRRRAIQTEGDAATEADPADTAISRESARRALVAALRYLPPRQRAVLILREVLCWRADEVAALLETTTASVNSALQRARSTLAAADTVAAVAPPNEPPHSLLTRYVAAFERYDLDSLRAVVHDDALASAR